MTTGSSGGERIVQIHHGARFAWGRMNVSVGAAALFEMRPREPADSPRRYRMVFGRSTRFVHPPLEVVLTTGPEMGQPPRTDGLGLIMSGEPGDSAWEAIMWGDAPPPAEHPELVGYESAHAVSEMARYAVSEHLPRLLGRETRPSSDMQLYANALGGIVSSDIHDLYCAEAHR